MKYYPAYLDISNRPCVVVGGGHVAARKAATLVECGAAVTVVSPELTPTLTGMVEKGKIRWQNRTYRPEDLEDAFLVIVATNNRPLNHQIHSDARQVNTMCNIADQPELCDFILPSLIKKGDLVITVSTTGKSPAYAKKLKNELTQLLGEEHALFLELMGAIRERYLANHPDAESNRPVFKKLVDAGLVEMIRNKDVNAINQILESILGRGYEFDKLMNKSN